VGGSGHAFVRAHNCRYGGICLGYGGAVHRRFVTGGLAEVRRISIPRTRVNMPRDTETVKPYDPKGVCVRLPFQTRYRNGAWG
jgi:hypothetical protein